MHKRMIERFSLKGRRALVTGSSRGIGRAIAMGLAEAGADVCVHHVGSAGPAEQLAREIEALGQHAGIARADLAADDAADVVFDQAVAAIGGLDILVLNASVQVRAGWDAITREQFDQQIAVNLRSSLELVQHALPGMQEQNWGRVVTIGSVQQARPHPHMLVYAASKCAQASLARNLAKQVAADGITVNDLAPGVIDTDRNRDALADHAYRAKVLAAIPSHSLGHPDDCVGACLLLCSEAGRYITGQTLYVDGGMSL